MLDRHKNLSTTIRYEMVAEALGLSPRYVRYLEKGERKAPKHIEKLIRIMS